MITVVGWPRSGTHWLKKLLEFALEEEVAQSHDLPETTQGKHVLIVRDPRDVFASHWRLFKHDHPGTEMSELAFVDYFMKGEGLAQAWGIGWVPHTRALLSLRKIYPLVKYEKLYRHPEKTLFSLARKLGYETNLHQTMEAVQRTKGVRCDPSTLPVSADMGWPGKWEGQLQPATTWALLEYCAELMDELGYARLTDG